MIGGLFGLKVYVVPSWVRAPGYERCGPHLRTPSKADGRTGTRRAWKRQQRRGLRWGTVPVEPDHVIKTDGAIYCTAAQYRRIKAQATTERRSDHDGYAMGRGFL